MNELPQLDQFPSRTYDKLRYGDTDRQGHVNNAVFVTLLETGRVSILDSIRPMRDPDLSFVIARLCIDYRGEIFWPGTVEIGTGVKFIGTTSITFAQALFQNGNCVATAESIIVHVSNQTRRAEPLGEELRQAYTALI